jgi:hypothetical protein
MNTRHEVLDWFGPSRGVIALHPVLMYYAIEIGSIEIGSSLFLSGSFWVLPGMFSDFSGIVRDFPGCLPEVLDVDQSSLFIVGEPTHRV